MIVPSLTTSSDLSKLLAAPSHRFHASPGNAAEKSTHGRERVDMAFDPFVDPVLRVGQVTDVEQILIDEDCFDSGRPSTISRTDFRRSISGWGEDDDGNGRGEIENRGEVVLPCTGTGTVGSRPGSIEGGGCAARFDGGLNVSDFRKIKKSSSASQKVN